VLRFGEDGEAYLDTHHPGVSIEEVQSNTGWKLKLGASVRETKPPNAEELRAIREYDTKGFWTS
jgi:glutaconate CoA-transferase subunit B